MGTRVQEPAEIERLLEGTSVGLLLDTGHLTAAGGDPVQAAATGATASTTCTSRTCGST